MQSRSAGIVRHAQSHKKPKHGRIKIKGWIGVDLDGTLAHYEGFGDGKSIGEPIPLMLERVKSWLKNNKKVKIMTARVARGSKTQERIIKEWCLKHVGCELEITCCKDFAMIELWDDRAIRVKKNTGEII